MFKPLISLFLMSLGSAAVAQLRDPTIPGNLPSVPMAQTAIGIDTALELNAIWISDSGRRAMVNHVTVTPGQELADGSRVVKIFPSHIVIRQNGNLKKLYLVPSVKKPVK